MFKVDIKDPEFIHTAPPPLYESIETSELHLEKREEVMMRGPDEVKQIAPPSDFEVRLSNVQEIKVAEEEGLICGVVILQSS